MDILLPSRLPLNNTWTGTNTFTGIISGGTIQARTSAGLLIDASNGTDVVLFGAGNGANATFYGGITASGSVQSIYSIVSTTASLSETVYAAGLTKASNLISVPYLDMGVACLVTFSTTDDNATKPKAGIVAEMTTSGTNMYFGTSNVYSVGITNYGLAINSSGKVLFRVTTSATAQANFIRSSDPVSPVDGDWWYNGTNLKFCQGGTTRTITWA